MQFSGKETTFLINDVSLVLRLTSLVRSGLENKEGILSDSFQKMSVLVMLIECLVSRCQLANRQLEFFFICLKAYQINQSPSTKFLNLYVSSPSSLFLFIEALVATCRGVSFLFPDAKTEVLLQIDLFFTRSRGQLVKLLLRCLY